MKWYLKVLRNYAEFKGRARRTEFWMFALFNFIFTVIAIIIDIQMGTFSEVVSLGVLSGLYSLFVLIPSIAVSVRRLHDTNRSGWWFLLIFIPFIGPLWLLVLYIIEGTHGDNKYGHDPTGLESFSAEDEKDFV